jgi:RND superfamily putative drug exporter
MVKAADTLKGKLSALSAGGVQVHLTGASGMWSDFNAANRSAMLKSEVISRWESCCSRSGRWSRLGCR